VAVVRNALALLEAGEAVDFEGRIRTKHGEERWVRHRARPGRPEADGTVVHYHGGEDVTDRKRFEQELIAAREQAEEMARLKSAFLANMSHEIRTPLTGILGYAGVLADEVTEPEHRESVEFIERSGHRLLETLDSVLELARLEANGVRPHAEVLDIAAEARLSAQLLAPVAEAKGVGLDVEGQGPAHARLDRACLARILNNLIGNAVKFTEAGRVEVAVGSDDSHAHIRISDTGVGIDAHFLPRIFDEFRQESDGDARHHEGAGLGLAITRRLVDVLGGAVAVESEKGVGTTVTVTFPLHAAPPPEVEGDTDHQADQPVAESPVVELLAEDAVVEPISDEDLLEAIAEASDVVLPDFAPDTAFEEVEALAPTSLDSMDDSEATDIDRIEFNSDSSEAAEGDLLDLIFPSDEAAADEELSLAWADEEQDAVLPLIEEGDGSWMDAADASLEALFAPEFLAPTDMGDGLDHEALAPDPALGFDMGDGQEAGYGTGVDAWSEPSPEPDHEVRIATPPPLTSNAMDAALTDGNGSATSQPQDPSDMRPAAQGPSVLVVEDNSDTRALLERILKPGYTTFAVGDARSALDLLHRERFDALVLDINLGGRETGVDVLRIARALPGNDALFAIALTAYALPGDRERFLEAGFDQYVSKPFTRSTLLGALKEGLGETKA
jgi:signal transduction histidine kinase/CheY-like chemotaxis protein